MKEKTLNFTKILFSKHHEASSERSRRLLLTTFLSFVSKAISFLVLLISVPLTLKYLNTERFGVLSTIISTFSVLTFADLGMGMGLQNLLPNLIANKKQKEINQVISTAFYFLISIAILLLILGALIIPHLNFSIFFNTGNFITSKELSLTIFTYLLVLCIGIPVSLIQRIQNAYQESYYTEIWITIGNIMSLIALVVVTRLKLELPAIVLSMQGVVLIFFGINFFYFTVVKKKYSIPSLTLFDTTIFKQLLLIGTSYLLISICALFVNSIDSLLIARVFGLNKVAEYTIGFRLVSFFAMPIQIISLPLLSAYNDAWVRQDKKWLKKVSFQYIKLISVATMVSIIVFFFFGNFLIKHWTGTPKLGTYQLIAFSFLLIYMNLNVFISMIALSSRFIKYTLKIYPFAVVIAFLLKLAILYFIKIDYTNIIWATVFAMSAFFFLPIIFKIIKEDYQQ